MKCFYIHLLRTGLASDLQEDDVGGVCGSGSYRIRQPLAYWYLCQAEIYSKNPIKGVFFEWLTFSLWI